MDKLPDEEAACNIIMNNRRNSRLNHVTKTITIKLFEMNDYMLSTRLNMVYNINTNNIAFAHCLSYKNNRIYPTTNLKLRCTNKHALDMLAVARDLRRKLVHKSSKIQFGDTPGKYTRHYEHITYNKNNGNVCIVCGFRGIKGHKLPVIDIG